ncbi:MAG: hypothetical protein LUF02_11245 [Erysipelotrichaceae bacterium]|nr:hypothetical protein [Erysipelotrichaceae bacterium]
MKAIKKILILCMLFITGCRYQNNMSISNIYTNEDIDEAITCVKTYFKDNYGGCTLIDTYYVGDSYEEEFKEYALIYDVDEAIIISYYLKQTNWEQMVH